jgi:hypothetical protein
VLEQESGVQSTSRAPRAATPAKPSPRYWTWLFASVVIAALVYGFLHRGENWITPERGLGYFLGVAGALCMLILLSYPLRKRFRAMRGWGKLPAWLNGHMLLGIIGPTLILFHANFALGAMNSNVALFAMLTVVGSGIVGRYIYGKTHNRLSGEMRNLDDLRSATRAAHEGFQFDFATLPELRQELEKLEARVLNPEHSVFSSTWLCLDLALSEGRYRSRAAVTLKAAIATYADQHRLEPRHVRVLTDTAARYVSAYMRGLRRGAEFRFYERMFALWHVLHVPLLALLIIAAAVHVAAVHLY